MDDTCNKDSNGDVDMKHDEVSLNIITNLFLPVLCGIVVHKEKRVKLYYFADYVSNCNLGKVKTKAMLASGVTC